LFQQECTDSSKKRIDMEDSMAAETTDLGLAIVIAATVGDGAVPVAVVSTLARAPTFLEVI
jgi:hypothetical protein